LSYAQVASEHRAPPSQQPHPDTGLLNTTPTDPVEVTIPDGASEKVTIAPADYKEHPKAAANRIAQDIDTAKHNLMDSVDNSNKNGSAKRKERKERAKEYAHDAEEETLELWDKTKRVVMQPGVAGGLLGFVNLGLIGSLGYKLYTEPGLRTNQRFLTTTTVGVLALFGAEGYFAEAYRQTDAGQREEAKAREEGAALYNHAKTIVLRPGVLGGIVGVVNLGILGSVGYWSYQNWDRPSQWDRRTVSIASLSLLALFTGEGYLGEQYKEKEYPKHK